MKKKVCEYKIKYCFDWGNLPISLEILNCLKQSHEDIYLEMDNDGNAVIIAYKEELNVKN